MPPVPWRCDRRRAAALAVALLAAAALLVPGILDERERAGERAREAAQRRHDQALADGRRASSGRAPAAARPTRAGAPGRAPHARPHGAARRALATRCSADAAVRGEGRVRGLDCEPFPRGSAPRPPVGDLVEGRGRYQCVAVTSRFDAGEGERGVIGIPFRLVADFARGRYAFCRVVPLSDRDRLAHPLPAACRL